MNVVAIIQARMGSTRLPGKVLMDMAGAPMLAHVIERVRRAKNVNEVVVATTKSEIDNPITELCRAWGWPCFRGSENDVLERYYLAAREYQADMIVRVTSDCPLMDPDIVDLHIHRMSSLWHKVDFATNALHRTFPLGLSAEALPFEVLSRMQRISDTPYLREHATTLAYERPELFVTHDILNDVDLSHLHWTVDTPADFEEVRAIIEHFGHNHFSWREVLALDK